MKRYDHWWSVYHTFHLRIFLIVLCRKLRCLVRHVYHKFMIVQWWLLSSLHLWNTTNSQHNYNYLPICFVENCLAWDQYFTIQWRILWGVQVGRWRIWQCFQMCPSTRWLYIRHQKVKNTSSWQRVWVSNDLFVLGQPQWLIKIDM